MRGRSMPVNRLGLTIRGSVFEPLIRQVHGEMRANGLRLRPRWYLSDVYGCVPGTCNIGLKWVEAIGRIPSLKRRFGRLVRSRDRIIRTLRHEVGHAFCYVHRLYRLGAFRRIFEVEGSYYRSYPDLWVPDAAARGRLEEGRHIGIYCLKHPDEDFAITFQTWLDPDSDWRRRYRPHPAIVEKLEYVDALVKRYGRRPYHNDPRNLDAPLSDLRFDAIAYLRLEHVHHPGSNYLPLLEPT